MQAIQDCKVSKNQNGYIITVYLDKQSTEFANELGTPNNNNNNNGLKREVNNYVSKKFPQIKNATVKLMVGTMLVGSFAYAAPTLSAHAAGDADGTTVTAQTEDGTTTDGGDDAGDGTTPGGGDDAGDGTTPGGGDDAGDGTTPGGGDDAEGTPTGTDKIKDVAEGKFYTDAVYDLIERGIITGYPDGTFKPGNEIKRAEFVNLLAKALDLDTENAPDPGFKDVTNQNAYYYGAVAALKDAGILTGYEDNTFRPNDTISRAEIAKLLVEAYDELNADEVGNTPFTDVVKGSWYEKYVSPLVTKEITKGKSATSFDPNGKTTRGEAATFIYRTLGISDTVTPDPDPDPDPEITPIAGDLTVTFAGFEDIEAGAEHTMNITVKAESVSQDIDVRYLLVLEDEDGNPVANQQIFYEATPGSGDFSASITTDADGVAYFGPAEGFKTEDIGLDAGVTTAFKTTFATAGDYTMYLALIDVDTENFVDHVAEHPFTVSAATTP